jgi:radical SAM superfamily enzyme YgiQ (UPF0313 family)
MICRQYSALSGKKIMKLVFVSQGPQFEPSLLPYTLLTGYAQQDPRIAEACSFAHESILAFGDIERGQVLENCIEAAKRIMTHEPQIVALSLYCWNTSNLLTIAQFIKQIEPSVTILAGGPDTYREGAALLRTYQALDVIIAGEGEVAFQKFLQVKLGLSNQESGLPMLKTMHDVPFACFREDGEIRESKRRDYIEILDTIPSAILKQSRDTFRTRLGLGDSYAAIVETSRGCPVNCAFCQYPKNDDGRMRYYSIERIIEELREIKDAQVEGVYFADGILTVKKERAFRIFEFFLEEFTEGRIHTEIKLDMLPELVVPQCRELFRQGRLDFGVGLQSSNKTTLKAMGRPTNFRKLEQTAKRIGATARLRWDLIYGLPGDSYEDLLRGMDYVNTVQPGALMAIQPLQVLPGTEYRESAGALGLIYDSRNPYMVVQSETFSSEEMRFGDKASRFSHMFWSVINFALTEVKGTSGVGMYENIFRRERIADYSAGLEGALAVGEEIRCWFASQLDARDLLSISEKIDSLLLDEFAENQVNWPSLGKLPACIETPFFHPIMRMNFGQRYVFRFEQADTTENEAFYRILTHGKSEVFSQKQWEQRESETAQ